MLFDNGEVLHRKENYGQFSGKHSKVPRKQFFMPSYVKNNETFPGILKDQRFVLSFLQKFSRSFLHTFFFSFTQKFSVLSRVHSFQELLLQFFQRCVQNILLQAIFKISQTIILENFAQRFLHKFLQESFTDFIKKSFEGFFQKFCERYGFLRIASEIHPQISSGNTIGISSAISPVIP